MDSFVGSNLWLLLLLLAPVYLIQLALMVFALVDLSRRKAVKGTRALWAIILVVTALSVPTGLIATALYLVWGRQVEEADDTD